MAAGRIEILGGDVFCSISGGGREARFPLDQATPKLTDWAKRYDKASERNTNDALAAIGRAMFDWLDGSGWASAWADALGDDRILEVKVGAKLGANETALLDAPWELIARADGPLALDALPAGSANLGRRSLLATPTSSSCSWRSRRKASVSSTSRRRRRRSFRRHSACPCASWSRRPEARNSSASG